MAKPTTTEQDRSSESDIRTERRARTFAIPTMVGGAILVAGATLVDLGAFAGLPVLGTLGNALSAVSGLGLLFLPIALLASRVGGRGKLPNAGAAFLAIGICLVSLVDVPAILDPTDLDAGGALGPVGLVLLSVGFLSWYLAVRRAGVLGGWRKYIFLLAGLWFFLTFPTVQLPLFVAPHGRPSFILLAGVFGVLQFLMGLILREQANDRRLGTAVVPRDDQVRD